MNVSKIYMMLATFILVGCTASKSRMSAIPEKGMYKIAILYPADPEKTFDMDYYENKHMPMMAGFLGKNLKFYEIDKGISGRTPTDKAPYVAIGYFYCYDASEYGKAISANREAVVSDIKKYTNIIPVIQISQIKQLETGSSK